MELDLSQKPNSRVADISLVDMPLVAESDSASVSKICELLEEGSRIVCIADRTGSGDYSVLTRLRDCLPGFVAVLDHGDYSDLSVPLAKSLSLGSDETDEKILQNRWQTFSVVTQRSNLPFTLIVPNADSLNQSRLTQIREFLRPINGRLILAGCDDVSKLFDTTGPAPDVTPSDKDVPPSSDHSVEPESQHRTQSTVPIADSSALSEVPTITDVVPPPKSKSKSAPVVGSPRTPRRLKSNRKPFGWLVAGLGLGAALGFLVATVPDLYGLVGFDRWAKGMVDGSPPEHAVQSVQPSETVSATTPEDHSRSVRNDVLRQEKDDATMMPPVAALKEPQEALSISPKNPVIGGAPAAPVVAEPVTDLAALEKPTATESGPEADAQAVAGPTVNESSTASQPIVPPAAGTDNTQTPEPESEPEVIPDPEERARIAAIFLKRAERELEIGNLQQSLLEVVRGLDVDPDNKPLQDLRQEVLADMDARTQ